MLDHGARVHLMPRDGSRSEEHTSELQSQSNLVCRLLLEKKKKQQFRHNQSQTPVQTRLSVNTHHPSTLRDVLDPLSYPESRSRLERVVGEVIIESVYCVD